MSNSFFSRGFLGKRREPQTAGRVPPGQYITTGFPVLSAGASPFPHLDTWTFGLNGLVKRPVQWTWEEFKQLPGQDFHVDIHCVTKWSKLDTQWRGVSVDTLIEAAGLEPAARYVVAFCDGGYTTNLPLEDIRGGKGFIGYEFDGEPLAPEHGGPARLVVPHLYFWKSAKWVRGLTFLDHDEPGFWEALGYHNRGDPWKEERYQGD